MEVHRGIVINRNDLKTSQDEADAIIIHQLCELVDNASLLCVMTLMFSSF